MNNYKSFSELKEELGNNYDFKLYEMGISTLKENEQLQQEIEKQKEVIDNAIEYIKHYETIRGYYEYEECGYDEYNYEEDLKEELLDILKRSD